MAPSIRARRVVSNSGPPLWVAYDLTWFIKNLELSLNVVQSMSNLVSPLFHLR